MLQRQCLSISYYSGMLSIYNADSIHSETFQIFKSLHGLRKSLHIFSTTFFHQVLGLSMAHLSCKMHSMAAHLLMQQWGKSNSCFRTVSGHHTYNLLWKTHYHTPFFNHVSWVPSVCSLNRTPPLQRSNWWIFEYVC